MNKMAERQSCNVAKFRVVLILLCTLCGFSSCQSSVMTSPSATPMTLSTTVALSTTIALSTQPSIATPVSSAKTISAENPSDKTTLQVSFDRLCILQTGESVPLSRADIYFTFRLYEPNGVSHTIHEVPQIDLIKHAADPTCANPLLFGGQQLLSVSNDPKTCLRIEGEFWNASRLGEDALVGRINEQVCFREGQWSPIGSQTRHLTGGGADWEVNFTIQQISN